MTAREPSPSKVATEHDFGILLALAYSGFVDEMRAVLTAEGHGEWNCSFGYVARALAERPLTLRELAERLAITSPGRTRSSKSWSGRATSSGSQTPTTGGRSGCV